MNAGIVSLTQTLWIFMEYRNGNIFGVCMSTDPGSLGVCTLSSLRPIPPPRSPKPKENLSGYLSKIETKTLGVISRRRYWFALSDASPYLYWYKERDDVQCVGRLPLSGAAFTYDPRQTGRFEIHCDSNVFVLETTSNRAREEWMRSLQEARKRTWRTTRDRETDRHSSAKDILSLTSPSISSASSSSCMIPSHPSPSLLSQSLPEPLAQPPTPPIPAARRNAPPPPPTIREGEGRDAEERDELQGPLIEDAFSSASALDLIGLLGGPVSYDQGAESEETTPTDRNGCFPPMNAFELPPENSSTFYLRTDGELNELSLEMPKAALSPEAILNRLAEQTQEKIENPARKALDRARKNLKRLSMSSRSECEECKKWIQVAEESDVRLQDAQDRLSSLEEMVGALKNAVVSANRQVDIMKQYSTLHGTADQMDFLLEREAAMTDLQLYANEQSRRVQEEEEKNREMESRVCELQSSLEAFRESVRTKEELIMRLCEEQGQSGDGLADDRILGDVEVPEGILVDMESAEAEEVAQKVFCEESVRDVHEMKDLVEGYRAQNHFLNQEIVELHNIIKSFEDRERQQTRKNFDIEACYYQLKSRYIMVLNHFKNPEKPGKIMEPGVLRELLDEANRTPRLSHAQETDTLGFYFSQGAKGDGDLFDKAATCMRRADEIMEVTQLEQSEEYMHWLQGWDGFLVNCVNRPLAQSNELKALVRSGVPKAYRGRVWKSLVSMWVRPQQTELGNGYFECMLKKAKAKKEQGEYDSAIKQIDLDLSRTLPTNKFFEDPSSDKVESLRRVLYAFRYHNKDVGYCQGLNRLAAIGLLYLSEEDAFWFLIACVEHLQPEGYYTSTLIGAVADQKVLRDLVQEKLPKFAAHLKGMEVDLSLFTLGWFLTCFVDILPHSVYLNIFDAFLYEGNKVLFRFALSILRLGEPSVLQCKTIGTVHATLSRANEFVHDYRTLSQVAFHDLNPFPTKPIETKRQVYLAQLREQGYR